MNTPSLRHVALPCAAAVIACLGLLLAGCGGGDAPLEDVPIVSLGADYADWPVRKYVIRTQQEWIAAWNEPLILTSEPRPEPPAVDFSTHNVLGVSDGWTGSCGTFLVKKVTRQGDRYRVVYGLVAPPPFTSCAAIIVPTVAFVLVPQPVGSVDFVRLDE
jgi:hypothetical protein